MFEHITSFELVSVLVIALMNVYTGCLYYSDKQRAIKKQPRISEKKLLVSAFALGGVGAWIGMSRFRHKTKHLKFKLTVPIAAAVTVAVVFMILDAR